MNLGGFAEGEWAVDGDFESFNYCVAENYFDAMFGEDWELLGEGSFDMIENIAFWLVLNDPELGAGYDVNAIYNGSFKTVNGRTFIDAIIDAKREDYAISYIKLHVYDVRLYILCMFKCDEWIIGQCYNGTILNFINYSHMSGEERLKFLTLIFNELEKIYNSLSDIEEKQIFLNVVYKNIKSLKWHTCNKNIDLGNCISKPFARVLVNKDRKGE